MDNRIEVGDIVICVNNQELERFLVMGQQYTVYDTTTENGVKYISVQSPNYNTMLYFRVIYFECIVAKRNEIIDNILQ